jgi:hypothetical protein
MICILKNKTSEEVEISYENTTVVVFGNSQADLSEHFVPWQLGAIDYLLALLGQGTDFFQINDGESDLTLAQGIDAVRGYGWWSGVQQLFKEKDGDGTPKFVSEYRSDVRCNITTHNFCDATTWFQGSVRVTDEEMTTQDPARETFTASHALWIDLIHGKVADENEVSSAYVPVIKVDGEVVLEDLPFGGEERDYYIDYKAGTVFFHEGIGENAVVTASYSYATNSTFEVRPVSGKMLRLIETECQLSTDMTMKDDLWYGIYATLPGIGEVLVKEKRYKTVNDFIAEASGSYPLIPAFGGDLRGCAETVTFKWDLFLQSRTDIKSSLGMAVKVHLDNNIECEGSLATVTFRCLSITE